MTPWLEAVAEELSGLLQVPWRVALPAPGELREGACYLRRQRVDGGQVFVSPPSDYASRGKKATHLTFSVDWPRHPKTRCTFAPWDRERGAYARLERTVSTARDPLRVASELRRHVLGPAFGAFHSQAWGQLNRAVRDIREQEELLEALGRLGASIHANTARLGPLVFYVVEGGVTMRESSQLPRDLVLDVARLVAQHEARSPSPEPESDLSVHQQARDARRPR